MEMLIKHFSFALLIVFVFVLVTRAQVVPNDQSGFISIDCGLPESAGSYSEASTGINYVSDEPFINTGVSKTLLPEYQAGYQKQLAHLRAFPEGIRNCYTVNITKGTSYLIRATFYYGNYDNKSYPPGFDIHLGANFWDTIIFYFDFPLQKEIIHVPLDDYVRVCLVNNGTGTPFISVLRLRPLVNKTYVTSSGSLALDTRVDLGSITNLSYRYPYDAFDRGWSYYDINNYKPNWTTISTPLTVNPGKYYKPPSEIMSTAITPTNVSEPLVYTWFTYQNKAYYVYLHFSEIQKLKANQSRSFDIFLNGELYYGPLVLDYLNVTTIYSTSPLHITANSFGFGNYTFSLIKRKNSTLPPILNAIEIYTSVDFSQSETSRDDVEAIKMIKSTYGELMKRNWDGDPCAPIKYLWEGLNCSYDGSNPPRITSLNLSSNGMTGEITSHISKLTMLQSLDLSNNNLTGPVPKFLSQMPNLKVLNLKGNNFTGSIPAELVAKSKNGSLSLSIDTPSEVENTNKCNSAPCETKKKSNILVPIVSSVGGLALLLLAAAGILIAMKRKEKQVPTGGVTKGTGGSEIQNDFFVEKKRQFTYSEVSNITENFVRVLGRGGFGTVYHGCIGDMQVAVKKLSSSSVQGYQQFQAEVKLLMAVHHRNLTSLIGYCIEGNNMALIYEYMTNGDLDSHLLDEGNANVLSWERRLQIAMDAAQGLEYLHNGCKPPIVHRDVKTSNILLNENFQAKLADFGLSRTFPTDGGSHVSTVIAGTPGYLDPEYSTTNRLTEKSDVYSFGVVLLQIITCRTAILSRGHERTHISQWVRFMLDNGDIVSIVDKRLRGDFETNSVWKAVEIAMACISQNPSKRPDMNQVVAELKDCLVMELARIQMKCSTHL